MQPGDWVSGEVRRLLIKRLVKEAGISQASAGDLIDLLGPAWPSLIREAKNLQRER